MKIESIRIGMRVRHPQYGSGSVLSLTHHAAEIAFADGHRSVAPETSGLEPDEPAASVTGLTVPLEYFLKQTVLETVAALGLEKTDVEIEKLGVRWHGGRLVLHPADTSLQAKEVPLEVFFHKIVMMRNQLRVLEQKLNGHPQLTDGDKVELQQYISRCYGTMTTFNVLFRDKADHFSGKAE
ncbi:MAG: hypothetical protein HY301_13960 [Verrucomicrobia bacterium]|nr:hypothetical protein [Verrucomicrobiota bacterium]